eukprot:7369890-Ditylum_brightwellii.AAC.1
MENDVIIWLNTMNYLKRGDQIRFTLSLNDLLIKISIKEFGQAASIDFKLMESSLKIFAGNAFDTIHPAET